MQGLLMLCVVVGLGSGTQFDYNFNEGTKLWEYSFSGSNIGKRANRRSLLQDMSGFWYDIMDRHSGQKCLYVADGENSRKSDLSWANDFDCIFTNIGDFSSYGLKAKYFFDDGLHPVDLMTLGNDVVKFVDHARLTVPAEIALKLKLVPMRIFSSCSPGVCEYFSSSGVLTNSPEVCESACDNCFCSPDVGTVAGGSPAYIALQILYFLGCQTVYTLGLDDYGPNMPPYVPSNWTVAEARGPATRQLSLHYMQRATEKYTSVCRDILDATSGTTLDLPFKKINYRAIKNTRPDPSVTIFSIPKDFMGSDGDNQQLVLRSWLSLSPRPRIQLYGPARNIETIKANYPMVEIYPNVQVNAWGIPTLGTPFALAQAGGSDVLIYANMDIMFSRNLTRVIRDVYHAKTNFLVVGLRYEVDAAVVKPALGKGDMALWETASKYGKYGGQTFFDYFIFSKGLYPDVPEFCAGRAYFDWYFLLMAMRNQEASMVDATYAIGAYHMNHQYNHIQKQYAKGDGSTILHRNDSPDTIHNTLLYAHAAGQYEDLLMSKAFNPSTGRFTSEAASKLFRSKDIILMMKDMPRYITYEGNCDGEIMDRPGKQIRTVNTGTKL